MSSTTRTGDVVVESGKEVIINLKNREYTFVPNEVDSGADVQQVIRYSFDVLHGGTLIIKNGTVNVKTSDFEKLINNAGSVLLKDVQINIIEDTTKKLNELAFNTGDFIIDGVKVDSTLNTSTTLRNLFGISNGKLTVTGKTTLISNDQVMLIDARYTSAYENGYDIIFDAFIEYGKLDGVIYLTKNPANLTSWKEHIKIDMSEFRLADFM